MSRSCTARASSARICEGAPATASRVAAALDERRRVGGHDHAARRPEVLGRTSSSVSPASSAITAPPQKAARSPRCWMRRWPKPGRAHGDGLERAVLRVGDEHAERAAVDLLGQDDQRARVLHHEVEHRQEVVRVRDRLVRHEDVRVLEHRLHALRVAHHVGRDPAVLDVHALDEVDGDARQRRLLQRHDAVGADAVQRLRHGGADQLVLLGGDRGDVLERLAALDRPRRRAAARPTAPRSPARCRGAGASGSRPRRAPACPRARSPGPAAWPSSCRRR